MANSADPDQLASSEGRTYPGSAGQGINMAINMFIRLYTDRIFLQGALWCSGKASNSRSRGTRFDPH